MVIDTSFLGRFLRGVSPKMVKLSYKRPKMPKASTPKIPALKVPHYPKHVSKLVVKVPKIKVPKVKIPTLKPIRVRSRRR
jgi:hypothetical protein